MELFTKMSSVIVIICPRAWVGPKSTVGKQFSAVFLPVDRREVEQQVSDAFFPPESGWNFVVHRVDFLE